MIEAGLILLAGLALIMIGIGLMIGSARLAKALIQRFGWTNAQGADPPLVRWLVLGLGLVLLAWGVTIAIMGIASYDLVG